MPGCLVALILWAKRVMALTHWRTPGPNFAKVSVPSTVVAVVVLGKLQWKLSGSRPFTIGEPGPQLPPLSPVLLIETPVYNATTFRE